MSINKQEMFNSFGEALYYAIEFKGLSQSEFAKKIVMDEGQLSKYVNNESMPRPRTIKKIEQGLSILFRKTRDGWMPITDKRAQMAIDRTATVGDLITLYKATERVRDDIPGLLELIDMIEADVDKLVRKKRG